VKRDLEGDIKEKQRLRAALKKLAADIRELSAGRRRTPSEDLLREGRDER
jgi:plasmid stability protein